VTLCGLTTLGLAGCKKPTKAPTAAADPTALGSCFDPNGGDYAIDPSSDQLAAGIPCLRFDVDVGDAPSRGPADAPVTIVMFSDFECPFCLRGYDSVKVLEKRYPGKIRFVYKAFPIDRHPHALLAALIAHSAQAQGKFWEFHDRVMSKDGVGARGLAPDALQDYASAAGLDLPRVAKEVEALQWAADIRRDMRQAKRLAVDSTPSFFVNGRPIAGAVGVAAFERVIEEELATVAELRSTGIPAAKVYDHLTDQGWGAIAVDGQGPASDGDMVFPVPLDGSPERGPKTAAFTIVVFGDFECPFCVRGWATLEALRLRYGDSLRIVHKHFPLPGHDLATPASRAAHAAGVQGRFWEFHDALYARGAKLSESELQDIARELRLDLEQWERDRTSTAAAERVARDVDLARRLQIDGTPTFFVNGRRVNGALPEIEFRMLLAEEQQRVDDARAQGISAERMYEHLAGLTEGSAP
jgi:protein-disulfide isomerase